MRKMIIVIVIVFGGLIAYNLIKQAIVHYYFAHYHAYDCANYNAYYMNRIIIRICIQLLSLH